MPRPSLELADIFRTHGPAWRQANAGHVSLTQLKVMSSIEACRSEALGGHVAGCANCGHQHIAYNFCKNRHCPKCQGPTARDWMAARAEDLLPAEYFHVVFTLPAKIAQIAYWNKKAAPVAVRRCGSSRSSGAGRRRAHAHHRRSRPHDETPIPLPDPPPLPLRDLHGLDLPPAEKFAKFGGWPPSFEVQSRGN